MFSSLWKRLMDHIHERVYVKVGDELCCSTWGESWTVVKVIAVSDDGLNFLGYFKKCKGKDCISEGPNVYSFTINHLNDTLVHCK